MQNKRSSFALLGPLLRRNFALGVLLAGVGAVLMMMTVWVNNIKTPTKPWAESRLATNKSSRQRIRPLSALPAHINSIPRNAAAQRPGLLLRNASQGSSRRPFVPPLRRADLGAALEAYGGMSVGVELGVQQGKFALLTLDAWKSCKR